MLDKIAQIYGVDPAHFRQLLKLDKTVASRAKGDKNGFAIFSYGLVCCFHVILAFRSHSFAFSVVRCTCRWVRLCDHRSIVHNGDDSVFELLAPRVYFEPD